MHDLISRQAAIDKIAERQRKLIYCFGFENDMVKIMDIARSIIIAMPSAEPERKKGEWIDIPHTFMCKCSECDWINNDDSGYNYCPNCGADMRNSTKPKSCFECEYSVDYDDDTVMCSEVKGIISISQNHDMIPTFCPKYVEQI